MNGKERTKTIGKRWFVRVLTVAMVLMAAPLGIAQTCPCTIWPSSTTPATPDGGDPASIEVGVRFRADVAGYITGIRFYKATANAGAHTVNLWSNTGTLLATSAPASETTSGWQQADFAAPVAITANTTYVASYFAPGGHYTFDANYFATTGVDNTPLHALVDGLDGSNGVYLYASSSGFPTGTFNSSNYWVDVVFVPNDAAALPRVLTVTPASGSAGIGANPAITAFFSKPMNPATITGTTFRLVDSSSNPITATVSYDPSTHIATLTPTSTLALSTAYTVTVMSGASGVKDTDGNAMAADVSWSFTTGSGPILVISSQSNPFTRYYAEILQAEGLNEFTVSDISTVTASALANYSVVILGDMTLTSGQVVMLTNWVDGGGNLVAMHPDSQLAGLLGLTPLGTTLSNAYLQVQTGSGPGAGIVGDTIQFHGPADLYTLNGATSIATLYSNATTATASPAVTVISAGIGHAAAFTYDLARSVVYTRQGNPAWSGQGRLAYIDPSNPSVTTTQIRSVDLFYGNASFDPQPDWVDLSKVVIPQADEQQRLLANLIGQMNLAHMPLPRFWYFPKGVKAVIVMTGDDHNNNGTEGRFNNYDAASSSGCSVADWECIRATSYIWPSTPISDAVAAAFVAQGFEISFHPDSTPTCSDWTPSSLAVSYANDLATFKSTWPSVPSPATVRTHCVTWSDYDTQPKVELSNGIRLDTNYYYWPDPWVLDRPGFFTGSGMPMRFADRNGNIIDVYQATTQLPDETTWTMPQAIDTLLNNAVGPLGYYGAITTNFHTDFAPSADSDAVIAAAQSLNVPIVSAKQMLTWLDGRNESSFGSIGWSGNTLNFTISVGAGARNLQAMLPVYAYTNTLNQIQLGGTPISFTTQVIKGVTYAFFPAAAGSYQAFYTAPPLHGAGLSSASIIFANQHVNTTSAEQSVTLSSTGTLPLAISSITLGGTNSADFAETTTCGASLAAGSNCAINVTFTPSVTGARTATITISDDANDSPQTIVLSGAGGLPTADLSAPSLAYGTQLVGATTAAQTITLTNNGTVALNISSIVLGGANSGDFSPSNNCGASVAAGGSCAINVTFTPSVTGARTAAISIADDATGSPHTISLSGTGTAPVVGLSSSTVTFSNQLVGTTSAAQVVTVNNTGTAALAITGITVGGTNGGDFAQSNNCGASVAAGGSCAINVTFTPSVTGARTAAISIADDATGSPHTISLSGTGTAPVVGLSSSTVTFSNQLVGTTSAAQVVTVNNTGTAALAITGITVGGTNGGDFAQSNNCGASVAAGGSCAINVTFTPSVTGARTAAISIADSATGSPHTISLSGTGTAPVVGLSSSTVTFSNQLVGTTSAAQVVTVNNTGTAALAITGITVGGTNGGDFAQSNNCGASVAAGGSCAINVTFTPSVTGARTAAISIADDATGSPHTISLSGTGTAPVVGLSSSTVTFSNQLVGTTSAAQVVTVNNTGTAALAITGITVGGTNGGDFAQSNNCGASVAAGGSCAINVTFTPSVTGARTAAISIADSATGSPHTISLSGTGTAPVVGLSSSTVTFSNQLVGTTSAAQVVTVNNTGTAALAITGITVGGTNGGDFAQSNNCGASVAAGGSCAINVTFTPSVTGARTAAISIADDATGSPHTISLSGTGTAPVVGLSSSTVTFSNQLVGTTSAAQVVTVNNTGTAALAITGITVGGTNGGDFAQSNNCGASVAAGGSCAINVTFTPSVTGARTAAISIADSATGSPHTISLSGTGTAPVVGLSSSTVTFSNQLVGTTSAAQVVTVNNTGTAALAITGITVGGTNGGDFAQSNNCGASVAAGGSCAINVTFTPSVTGARTAAISIADDATGSPHTISLSGTGTAPVVGLSSSTVTFSNQLVGTTSAAQVVTVNNTGTAALAITGITVGGTNGGDFAQSNNCGASVAAGGSCAINVTFTPSVTGARTAAISIADSATGSPHTISLSGTGTAPVVGLSSSTVTFSNQLVGTTSAAQVVTVNNTGTAALAITGITVGGTNGGDFAQSNNCGASVAAGGSCAINVTFTPSVTGARTAAISIADSATGSPHTISLSGTGTAPVVGLSSSTVTFSNQLVGTTSAAQVVTVNNTGTAALAITGITVGGTNGGDFAQSNNCGASVAAGGSCAINVTFTPSVTGARTAAISIADDATGSPHTISLSGTGTAPVVGLSSSTVTFSNQLVGTTSAAQVVTVNNTGTAALAITGITVGGTNGGDFAQSNNCGASVAAGGSCAINVTFTPSVTGARTAAISIADSATGSPHTISLSGTGTAPVVGLSSSTVTFSNQLVGTTSAAQVVTVNNTGTAALAITGITVGGTNGGDFAQSNNCGASVAAGGSCAINVTFTPSVTGARTAAISIADDATGSPHTISLSGTGTAPVVGLSSSTVAFSGKLVGTQATAQTVTLSNSGTTSLSITGITVGGTNSGDFAQTNNCGASVAAGGTCTINVTFTPSATGARTAAISIADDATGSPHTISLSGRGIDFSLAVPSGSSATQTVRAGQTATYNLQLAMTGGSAPDSIGATITCSGAPTLATCSPSSSPVTATPGSPATLSVTVHTTGSASSVAEIRTGSPRGQFAMLIWLLPGAMVMAWPKRRRKQFRIKARYVVFLLTLVLVLFLVGCGGGGSYSPPVSTLPGTYTMTVTATSGSTTHSTQLTLVVQ